MLYTVVVVSRDQKIRFRFNKYSDMIEFARDAADSVDGFNDGSAYVLIATEPEPEVIRNDI